MNDARLSIEDLLRHDAWVRRLARRLVADPSAAEDVVQDTWAAALHRPPRVPTNARAWLARVVRNLAGKHRRTVEARSTHEARSMSAESLPSVADAVAREEARRRLVAAVFALDEPYRTTILHRYFHDLHAREIANRLGASPSAIEKRITRGLAKLRATLDRDFGDRRAWGVALGGLVGPTAAGATGVPILTGAIAMSTKGLAAVSLPIVLIAGAAWMLWPTTGDVPPTPAIDAKPKPAPVAAPPTASTGPTTTAAPIDAREPAPASAPVAPTPPVALAIIGSVVDANGRPVVGASIEARVPSGPGSVDATRPCGATTGDDGAFTLGPIRKRCLVVVRAQGFANAQRWVSPPARADFALETGGTLAGTVRYATGDLPCAATVAAYRAHAREFVDPRYMTKPTAVLRRPPIGIVRTDEEGRYRLDGVPAGAWYVRVLPDRGVAACSPEAIPLASGSIATWNAVIALGATLTGRVVDRETSAGIADAEVTLWRSPKVRTRTNEFGEFTLAGVQFSGGDVARVTRDGYVPTSEAINDVSAFGGRALTMAMSAGAVVAGRVVDAEGDPVSGARVSLSNVMLHEPSGTLSHAMRRVEVVTTDDAGRFELAAFRRERPVTVYARKDGVGWGASVPVSPFADAARDVSVRFGSGRIRGAVRTEAGLPVPDARVLVMKTGRTKILQATAHTDDAGRFSLDGVPAGEYALEVVPFGVDDGRASELEWTTRVVRVGDAPADVEIVVRRGATIGGRVIDTLGRPVPDANIAVRVAIVPGNVDRSILPRLGHPRTVIPDEDGRYVATGLDPTQTYLLTTIAPGHQMAIRRNVPTGETAADIVLTPLHEIRGRVVSERTRAPIREFALHVALVTDDPKRTIHRKRLFADPDGRFAFAIAPGTYSIQARSSGDLVSATRQVEAQPRGGEVELAVAAGANVNVYTASREGAAIVGVRVRIYDTTNPGVIAGQATSDVDGTCAMHGIRPGRYLVFAHHTRSGRCGTAEVAVSPGEARDLRLAMAIPPQSRIVVRDERGAPVPDARVDVSRTDGVPIAMRPTSHEAYQALNPSTRMRRGLPVDHEAMTELRRQIEHALAHADANGEFRARLLPGEYRIEASSDGGVGARTLRVTGRGETIVVTIAPP